MNRKEESSELRRLQQWYAAQCDGDWEHQGGIRIGTLDNPGWSLDIDLWATDLASRAFDIIVVERSNTDWVHCKVEGTLFKARGGVGNLEEMLHVFLDWAESA